MFDGYRIVVVCPAGRRHVADLVRRYVERERHIVDEMHWWVNTDNQHDLEYMRGLAQAAPYFYRAFDAPGANFNRRHGKIGYFFRFAMDPDTIYVRIDDDVVWMDEHCIEHLVTHRLKFPEAYLVYGNIVNSSHFMHLHQKQGAFDPGFEIAYALSHKTNRGSFAAGLAAHEAILKTIEALAAGGDRETLLAPWTSFGRHIFAPGIHNDCNMISWFGRDFAEWGGFCPPAIHEEQWICLRMPCKYGGRIHEACGDALCVHYASLMQWDGLERHRPPLVARYAKFAPSSQVVRWTESMHPDGRSPVHADAVS